MATKNHKHLNSLASDEHNLEEYRKRVETYVDGDSVAYEDLDFISANSPLVCDVITDLGRIGHEGHVINDGPGDLKIETSYDGSNYGGIHTLEGGEMLNLSNMKIRKIRLTWVDNTSYRIMVA